MSEVSRKRSRSQEDDDSGSRSSLPPAENRTRDADYWFDDGNLILVAEEVEFRVYAAPLMRRSPVFREMLSLPQPQADGAAYLSIPTVRLYDHPTDVRRLLGSIIFGNDLRFVKDRPDFRTLSSLIRMGHKYQIDYAVEGALAYLQHYCSYPSPSQLTDLQAVPSNFSALDHIGVVNIARLTHTPELRLLGLAHCCTLHPKALVRGLKREDGTSEKLSPEDLTIVLLVRAELIKDDGLDVLCIRDGAEDCEYAEECRWMLMRFLAYHIGTQEQQSSSASWRQAWSSQLQDLHMLPSDRYADSIVAREPEKQHSMTGCIFGHSRE
ncbi:hypothetical protein K466DRAFT_545972 [Polyporus arcularius HHB13444]|uniref:BTB domain-containing protein n=1 Tax=Polyporus arcularius HHB13444 TaxID=1314778 RepID=A0A5C3PH01_9APHY|nr:hypothetical protein K466DRAFT_545972 [Polyporus arcularius HHB13444]